MSHHLARAAGAIVALVLFLMAALPTPAQAQMMHGHGADGTGHDEMNMPGLRGLDATPEESREMAVMFRNFQSLSRTVERLDNGIRTTTTSDDPQVMGALASHVMGMIDRVEQGRDPQVFIQSPTLDILFARRETITTMIDWAEDGSIIVEQTSTDPEVVEALHIHADEVTDMANRGMQAVHDAMMKRGG
jgi:TolA-binding protein